MISATRCAVTAGCVLLFGCGAHPTGGRTTQVPASTTDREKRLGLTRTHPRRYQEVCRMQAAEAPAGARTCPPLVPAGRVAILYSGRLGGRESDPGGFSADLASPSIGRVGGTPVQTNGGHWRYDIAWTPGARESAVERGVLHPPNAARRSSCRRERLDGRPMRMCRVVPYEQGGGINGGHIAYVWRDGSIAYVVSLHGYRNRARARAIVRALVEAIDAHA